MTQDQMQIGEVADRTGLSLNTLRHYDETGLVIPSARSQGGFRLYTEHDIERLLAIRRMKPLGFTLDEMRELLLVTDELAAPGAPSAARAAALRDGVSHFIHEAQQRRDRLAKHLAWAEEFIADLNKLSQEPTLRGRARGGGRPSTSRRKSADDIGAPG